MVQRQEYRVTPAGEKSPQVSTRSIKATANTELEIFQAYQYPAHGQNRASQGVP